MSDDDDYPALKRSKKVHYGGLDDRLREEGSKDSIAIGLEAGNIQMSSGKLADSYWIKTVGTTTKWCKCTV